MVTPVKTEDATLEFDQGVATLTLNRDDVRNALTGNNMVNDIVNACNWVNRTPEVSVLIITGAGKAFSAGGNIKEMLNRDENSAFGGGVSEVEQRYREGIQALPLVLHNMDVPVIAAVNGAAIGAGCDLACMCDIRIGSEHAKFGETFVNLGIIPGDGGAWFLQRLIGYQRAAEMTFTGRLVEATEAKELGLLMEVTSAEDLLPKAQEMARQMAAKPPQALRYAKRLMKKAQRLELGDFLELCAVWQGVCHNTEDHAEAVSAFVEKRSPDFKGR